MKITIIGAGAIGMLYAGYLSEKNDVVLIEKNPLAFIKLKHKKVNINYKDIPMKFKIKVHLDGIDKRVADLVIVTTKANNTLEALMQNKRIIGENTMIMTLQNGLGNREKLLKYFDSDHLITGVTRYNSIKLNDYTIKQMNLEKTIISYTENNFNKVKEIGEIFNFCKLQTIMSDNIERDIWKKLFINCVANPLTVIHNCLTGDCYYNAEINAEARQIIKEAVDVSNACGFDFNFEEVYNDNIRYFEANMNGKPSMWQDAFYKRKTEIDYLNGAIVNLAREYNIAVPKNEEIVNKIHEIEKRY